jgi:hypothetical protein
MSFSGNSEFNGMLSILVCHSFIFCSSGVFCIDRRPLVAFKNFCICVITCTDILLSGMHVRHPNIVHPLHAVQHDWCQAAAALQFSHCRLDLMLNAGSAYATLLQTSAQATQQGAGAHVLHFKPHLYAVLQRARILHALDDCITLIRVHFLHEPGRRLPIFYSAYCALRTDVEVLRKLRYVTHLHMSPAGTFAHVATSLLQKGLHM